MAERRDGLFVELYRQERILWDATHPGYFDRDKKRRTLQMIGCKIGMTDEAVKKKVNAFRTMYTRHLAQTVRIRTGSDPEYVPKWRWFSYLHSFLYPHVTLKKLENLSTQVVEKNPIGDVLSTDQLYEKGDTQLQREIDGFMTLRSILERPTPSSKALESEADGMIDLCGGADIHQLLSHTVNMSPSNPPSGEDEDSGPADPESSANHLDSEMSESDAEERPTSLPPACHPTPAPCHTAGLKGSLSPPAVLASLKKRQEVEPADKLVEMLQDMIRKRAEKRERRGFKRPNEHFVRFIIDEINKLSEVKQRKARLKIHQIIVEIAEEDE